MKTINKKIETDKMNFMAYFECKTLTTFTLKCTSYGCMYDGH